MCAEAGHSPEGRPRPPPLKWLSAFVCLSKGGGGSVRRQLALDLMIDDKPFYRHKHQCTHTSSDGHSMKRVTRTLSKRVTRTLSKRATRTRVEAEAEEEEEEEEEGSDPIGFRGLTQLGYVQT